MAKYGQHASNNRTPQQIAAVHHWGDTPLPIIWNNMLTAEIYGIPLNVSYDISFINIIVAHAYRGNLVNIYTFGSSHRDVRGKAKKERFHYLMQTQLSELGFIYEIPEIVNYRMVCSKIPGHRRKFVKMDIHI